MTTHTTRDGDIELTVTQHPHARECRYWVTYTRGPSTVTGDTIAKFAGGGDAFSFAATVIDRIDQSRARYTERLEEIQP